MTKREFTWSYEEFSGVKDIERYEENGVMIEHTEVIESLHQGSTVQVGTFILFNADGYEDSANSGSFAFFPSIGRIAIEYGADADWADFNSIEEAIEMFLNDSEEYSYRN